MTELPKIDPSQIVYHDEPTWYLTRCPSTSCKELWYFSHEIDSLIHNDDGTHTISFNGVVMEQNNFNAIKK